MALAFSKVKTVSNLVIDNTEGNFFMEILVSHLFIQSEILPFFSSFEGRMNILSKNNIKKTKILASQGKGAIYLQKLKKKDLLGPFCDIDTRGRNIYPLDLILSLLDKVTF